MPMNLRIVCPDSCAFDGTVAFVTVPTTDGEMGIAPLHASEISTIGPGYVRVAYCVSYDTIQRSLPSFRELARSYNLIP